MATELRKLRFGNDDTQDVVDDLYAGLLTSSAHHEHVYPSCAGEGVAADPIAVDTDAEDKTHAAGTDENYWGEPVVVVPVSTLTIIWHFLGAYVYGNTTAKWLQWKIYPIHPTYSSAKNGGNNWDEGATVLTVADGTIFATNDLVYITSSANEGEIVEVTDVSTNVVTIARETVQCACTGLRWDHTTDGDTETMWVCYRDASAWHGFEGEWSCASLKDFGRIDSHVPVAMAANTGLIIRAINCSDGATATAEIKIIYDHEVI